MRKGLTFSLAFHALILVLALVSLTFSAPDMLPEDAPIMVDVVQVSEAGNPPPAAPVAPMKQAEPARSQPKPKPAPQPAPEPEPRAERESPPPPPAASKPAPTPPEPTEPPRAEPAPRPEPKPVVERPKAEEEPPPKPKQEIVKPLPQVQKKTPSPPRKPPPAAASRPTPSEDKAGPDFSSVLKTVEAMKQRPSEAPRDKQDKKEAAVAEPRADPRPPTSFEQQIADALAASAQGEHDADRPISISDIDGVRRQIERCWNVPAGARDADDLVVRIRVEMNPDGTPRTAAIVDDGAGRSDASYRTAAESALRAVLNPRCHPFKLPPDKYGQWKSMTIVFNPKEMFGT